MRKRVLAATVLTLSAGISSSAWAGWGCAFDSSAGVGRQWGFPSQEEARKTTMDVCIRYKLKNCRLIGCSANVDTKEDADKIWARSPGVKYDNTCDGKKC